MTAVALRRTGLLLLALALAVAPAASAASQAPTPSEQAARSKLQRGAEALGTWAAAHGGRASVSMMVDAADAPLVDLAGDRLENPASNAKIFTAAVALATLGPEHRFTTGIYGKVVDGVAQRLVLRSDGDPSFSTRALEALVRRLTAAGLRRVRGAVLVDQSRFDERWVPPAFDQQPNEWAPFRAPVCATAIERNAITFSVAPTRAGEPARVTASPAGFAELVGTVSTGVAGAAASPSIVLKPAAGGLRVELGGAIAEQARTTYVMRRVDDPRRYAGHVLLALLRDAGVVVDGNVELGGADETEALAVTTSEPLARLTRELGKNSDNFYAEMVLKAVGAARSGRAGSSADGAAAIDAWLAQDGEVEPGTRFINGSGLFDANRATTRLIARTLLRARGDTAIGSAFVDQLAVGGVDGTLGRRFQRWRKQRAIRAKTGTLAKVTALSGLVLGPGRTRPVAFSIVVADVTDHDGARREIDRLVDDLARRRWGR